MGRRKGQPVKIANPTKAFILLVALLCVTVLLAIEKISTDAGLPIVTAIVFYAIGNGVGYGGPVVKPKRDE